MTVAWRLVPKKQQRDAFTGEGARIAGGRWNLRGTRAVYLASSLPLAALELLLYTGPAAMQQTYVAFRAILPDEIAVPQLKAADLPSIWRVEPPPEMIKRLGSAWLAKGEAAFLRVPSVILPEESILLANPAHPDFRRMKIGEPAPFSFNPRSWKA